MSRHVFNPNPHLTAVDVEHMILFLCGRSVPELERLLALAREATNKRIAVALEHKRIAESLRKTSSASPAVRAPMKQQTIQPRAPARPRKSRT